MYKILAPLFAIRDLARSEGRIRPLLSPILRGDCKFLACGRSWQLFAGLTVRRSNRERETIMFGPCNILALAGALALAGIALQFLLMVSLGP